MNDPKTRDSDTPRLLLLADHPSLHRGFATVAREVAGHLHDHGRWQVSMIGYYPPDPDWRSPGYPVLSLDPNDVPRSERRARLSGALTTILSDPQQSPQVILCMGTDFDLAAVADVLETSRARERLTLIGYTPIDYAPLPTAAMDVFARYDRLVPYTRLAREALVDCALRAGVDPGFIADPIPHGVDTGHFKPLSAAERGRARRELFGLAPNTLLVGYFGRNSRNKRIDIVLRLFALVVNGNYVLCRDCAATSAGDLDRDGRPLSPPRSCNACGGSKLEAGRPRQDIWLYLHTDLDAHRAGSASGGRDLRAIARALDVEQRVLFRDDIRIGRGDRVDALARRMAACDLHMLPYHCAGWELTVLETGACGVPNIITEVFSPPEYAEPFSWLVPVGSYVLGRDVQALMDTDLGLLALKTLLEDPARRQALAAQGPRVAATLDWQRVAAAWGGLLEPFRVKFCE
ncbi:MAG: glycosyltransferase [Gammaproteobacteria bacterium]|nr:glycosyltransferase [Gammaproteobacteria bacterium]